MRSEPRGLTLAVVAAGLTLVVGVGGSVVLWTQRGHFVPEVAARWGSLTEPNGFVPFASALVLNAMIATAIPLFLIVMGQVSQQSRHTGPVGAALAVFLGVLMHGALWQQRGLSLDEVRGASLAGPLSAAVLSAVAVSLAMVALGRRLGVPPAPDQSAAAPELPTHADLARYLGWSGRMRWSWLLAGQLVAFVGLVTAAELAAWSTGVAAIVLVNAATAMVFIVRAPFAAAAVHVTPEGVRVRGWGSREWLAVPMSEVLSASVVGVDPRADFGGWGHRTRADGATGLVTGRGPALRLERVGRRPVVITVTHPDAAARTVNELVERRWDLPGSV